MALGSFLRRIAGPAAGIATSLIPGVGPALAPLVGGAVGSLVGGGGGGGGGASSGGASALPPIDEEEAARRKGISTSLQGLAGTAADTSGRFLTGAEQDLSGARGFYGQLASGNPQAVGAALAPQLNQTRRQFQNTIDQISQFGGRGGGTQAALARARIGRAGALSALTGQAPYLGAQGLLQTAQTGGQVGLGTGELAGSAGRSAADISLAGERLGLERANVGQGQQRIDLARRGQNIDLYGNVGRGVADILGSTGIAGKIGRGLGKIFGFGNENKVEPAGGSPIANLVQPPTTGGPAAPVNIPPPQIEPGPVTSQYSTAYNTRRLAA